MKKFLSAFLSAVIACTGMCINANAGGEKKNVLDFAPSGAAVRTMQSGGSENCWNLSYSGYDITINGFDEELYALAYPEYDTDHILYLPIGTDGYKVTRIGESAFSGRSNSYSFTKVVIPNTVETIEEGAFRENKNLQEVELEEGSALAALVYRSSVGGSFGGCVNLKRIGIGDTDALPESLETIDERVFSSCRSLKSIDLSQCKLTSLPNSVFFGCSSLEKISFPKNLYSIGYDCFGGCESLTEVSFPATLEYIGSAAFKGCSSLGSVRFETFEIGSNKGFCSLETLNGYLDNGSFEDCVSLTDVWFAESISKFSIKRDCFKNTGLRSIDIPSCVTEIEQEAFAVTKLANEAHTKNGDAYSVGIFGNPTISTSVFGKTYDNISPDEVPKIAGRGTDSNAYAFTVKQFGSEFFVDLDGYNPFHYPHTIEKIPAVDATCQHTGLTEGERCTECGKIVTPQQETPLADHTPEIIRGYASTCIKKGLTDGEKCSVCGEIITPQQEMPLADHTPETIPGRAATEQQEGLTEGKRCSVCRKILVEQQTIPKLDHVHTPVRIPGTAATCTHKGLTDGEKCSVCGEIITPQQEIPLAEHTPKTIYGRPATCTLEGLTDGEKCSVCGEILKEQTPIPKSNHVYVNGVCTVCGEEQPTKQITIGDIDEDGVITSADALILLRYSVGLSADDEVGKTYYVK